MARLHCFLAAAAALLLALVCLPQADAAVAAIDLGTEWMKVALVKPGVPMEIVLNRESKRKTATAVTIRKSERFFGEDALNLVRCAPLHCRKLLLPRNSLLSLALRPGGYVRQFTRFPRDTYSRLLDLLGHYANDTVVADYNSRLPNVIEADERGAVAFRGDGDHQWLVEVGTSAERRTRARSATDADCPVSKLSLRTHACRNWSACCSIMRGSRPKRPPACTSSTW